MKLTMAYVIMNEKGQFWGGWKFIDEYPDAQLIKRLNEAKGICAIIKHHGKHQPKIVKNYGLENEEVVA